jgi:hypothetical protein
VLQIPDFEGLRGKITLLMISSALEITGWFMALVKLFGWKTKDDAPELP